MAEGREGRESIPRVFHSSPTHKSSREANFEGASDEIAHVMPSKFYKDRRATKEEIAKRHEKYGYDPLDKALQSEKYELEKKKTMLPSMFQKKRTPQEEYEHNVKRLLRDHLDTMEEAGIVFHHKFSKEKLGFHVLIARYGAEGRQFVQVDATQPHCEAYPEILKPTDELIEVNGKLIMDPKDGKWFDALLKQISQSKRPLTLTFIHGERRDEAFAEQEERRAMIQVDRPDASKSPLRGEAEQCARIAKLKLEDLKKAAVKGDGSEAQSAASNIEQQLSTCDGVAIDAEKRIPDLRYAAHVKEVAKTKEVTTTKLDECKAIATDARGVLKKLLAKLALEQTSIDDAERFASAATEARETAEDAVEKGHAQTLRQAVEDAIKAENGAKNVAEEVNASTECFPATVAAVNAAAQKASDERTRAEAQKFQYDAHQAAERILARSAQGASVRASKEDDVLDNSDIDDALARLLALKNRVHKEGDPATRRAVNRAYAMVARDQKAAQIAEHAAAAKAARRRAEDAAEKPDVPEAEAAVEDATKAADQARAVLLATIQEEEEEEEEESSEANNEKHKLQDQANAAKSDKQVAEAAACVAVATAAVDGNEEAMAGLDGALKKLATLRNVALEDPETTDEAKDAISKYAAAALGSKHEAEASSYAAAATKAREATEDALSQKDYDTAEKHVGKANAAAAKAKQLRGAVMVTQGVDGSQKGAAVKVVAASAKAQDESATAEAKLHAAQARAAREDADKAAEDGDVDTARAATARVVDSEAKVASVFVETQKNASQDADDAAKYKLDRIDVDEATSRVAAIGKIAASAAEDKALAEAATSLAAAKNARLQGDEAVKQRDPRLATKAANEAAQAAAKAKLIADKAEKSGAYSDEATSKVKEYASQADIEATRAAFAKHEAAAAAGRKMAEDAVVEADVSKAEAGAADASAAKDEALKLAKTTVLKNDKMDTVAREAAGRAVDHARLADAAKFEAMAASARHAAQKAADECDPSAAEDASNDAVAAELGVVQLLGEVDSDATAQPETKTLLGAVAARTTEDRQLADSAKFAAMASAGRRDAEQAAKDENFEAAAAAASDALAGEEGLIELVSRVDMDSSITTPTRDAIVASSKKATEDRQAAEASELVAAAIQARKEAVKASEEPNVQKADDFATAASDAHAAVEDLQKQVAENPDASKQLIAEVDEAESATLNQQFLAEAAKFAAMSKSARKAAEKAASDGDMYAAEAAASDARTTEAGVDVLKKTAGEAKAKPATKKTIDETARIAKGARQIAEAAKCAALSAQARQEAQKAAEEASKKENAEAARDCATVAAESEETIEEGLKQIQEILSNLRSDKGVSNEVKVAIAKYAQPIIEDRHLAEAAKLSASSTAARMEAEGAAGKPVDVDAAAKARAKFTNIDNDITQLLDLVESDRTLSEQTKQYVADVAAKIAADRRVAEAAECAARAAQARGDAVTASAARDLEGTEKFVSECRDADEIASAILEEAATSGCSADEVKAVKTHADAAKDSRLVAEGAMIAARAKKARESVEAAATVADNRKAENAKTEARQAVDDMNELKAAGNADPARSTATRTELGKYASSVYDDAKAAEKVVVPDKAQKAGEVMKKSESFAKQAAAARKKAETASAKMDEATTRKAADEAQIAATALDTLESEVAASGWYDASTKKKVADDAAKAAEDAAKATSAVSDFLERQALEEKRLAEEKEAAEKKKAEDAEKAAAGGGLLSGALGFVQGWTKKEGASGSADFDEGDEEKQEHFYGVTHSRFYMMPDSEEGVRLRDLAKAAAQQVANALADTRKAVKALNAEKNTKQDTGASRMNAINNAAAAVRRAQAKAKAVAELAEEAAKRADKYHDDSGSTQKQTDRADATSSVVGGFAEVAQADAKMAEKLYRATHVIKPPVRRGTKGNIFEKNAPQQSQQPSWLSRSRSKEVEYTADNNGGGATVGSASSAVGDNVQRGSEDTRDSGDVGASGGGSGGRSSSFADEQGRESMQTRQSNLMSTLGLSQSGGGRSQRGEGRSSSAGVNQVTTSLAFKIPDKEEGMKLRDLGKSYAEEAAKALNDCRDAVKRHCDPESKARSNSVQAGPQWKMHALNNAAAAKTRARVAATKCAKLAQDAKDRAVRLAAEDGADPEHVHAANATRSVVEGFSNSADNDANESNLEFEKTSVFKKRRDSDKK